MDLIPWRHAEAEELEDGVDDPARGLTPKGERHARRVADWLNQVLPHSTKVLSSPALRARQTAEALDRKFKINDALAPEGTVDGLLALGKIVVIVYPVPELAFEAPAGISRFLVTGRDPASLNLPIASFRKRQDIMLPILDHMGTSPNIIRVYPHERLCDTKSCQVYAKGKALYRDDNHLSQAGAEWVLPAYDAVFASRDTPAMPKVSSEITRWKTSSLEKYDIFGFVMV